MLRAHSSGDKVAPVLVAGGYNLVTQAGHVLTGYRGKVFEFTTQQNAIDWIRTNLARYKNKTADTGIDFLLQLGNIYLETGLEATNQELKDIYDYEHGIWQIVDYDAEEIIIDNTTVDWDGGDAFGN
jgi:hypothetical protein